MFTSVINVAIENTLETFHKEDLFMLIETVIRCPHSNSNWSASLKCNCKQGLCQCWGINNGDTYLIISDDIFCKLSECLLLLCCAIRDNIFTQNVGILIRNERERFCFTVFILNSHSKARSLFYYY